MPQQCPNLALLFSEAEVIAACTVGFAFGPFQLLDGFAEHGEIGDVFGLQVIAEFFLNGCSAPQVFASMDGCGLKDFREHHFRRRLLLILAVMTLNLLLVFRRKPLDAVAHAQLSHRLCKPNGFFTSFR